jgi:guanylate kinase
MSNSRRGRLFILSAPSGAGKTTIVRGMLGDVPDVIESVSYTTRPMADGEKAGVDYHFVDEAAFVAKRDAGGFLEWAQVFGGAFYGTGAADTERSLASGLDVFLVIDVQGARKVWASGTPAVGIFLLPPSFDVLESRLRDRHRDTEDQIRRRLKTAHEEMKAIGEYDYVLINDRVVPCIERLKSIVLAERSRRMAMAEATAAVAASFRTPAGA